MNLVIYKYSEFFKFLGFFYQLIGSGVYWIDGVEFRNLKFSLIATWGIDVPLLLRGMLFFDFAYSYCFIYLADSGIFKLILACYFFLICSYIYCFYLYYLSNRSLSLLSTSSIIYYNISFNSFLNNVFFVYSAYQKLTKSDI